MSSPYVCWTPSGLERCSHSSWMIKLALSDHLGELSWEWEKVPCMHFGNWLGTSDVKVDMRGNLIRTSCQLWLPRNQISSEMPNKWPQNLSSGSKVFNLRRMWEQILDIDFNGTSTREMRATTSVRLSSVRTLSLSSSTQLIFSIMMCSTLMKLINYFTKDLKASTFSQSCFIDWKLIKLITDG